MKQHIAKINKLYFLNLFFISLLILSIIMMFFIQFKVEKIQDNIALSKAQISDHEDQIRLLEVEWVFLTRPERLRQLSAQLLKDNGYALASQIKDENALTPDAVYTANYQVEVDENLTSESKI